MSEQPLQPAPPREPRRASSAGDAAAAPTQPVAAPPTAQRPSSSSGDPDSTAPKASFPRSVHRQVAAEQAQSEQAAKDGAVVPVGGATAAIQALQNPQGMHDVAFYQAVAEELPNSPVVHSILYTHRSVVDDSMTVEEAFQHVDKSVSSWRESQMARINIDLASQEEVAQREIDEKKKEDENRLAEYDRILKNMEDVCASFENKSEERISQEDDDLLKARYAMQQRHKDQDERNKQRLEDMRKNDEERHVGFAKIEAASSQAKFQINETLERGMLLSEEENERLALRFQYANSRQRIAVLEERYEWAEHLSKEEHSNRRQLDEWAILVHQRVQRLMRARELVMSLLSHTETSESGLRQNVEAEEEKERSRLATGLAEGPNGTVAIELWDEYWVRHDPQSPYRLRFANQDNANTIEMFFRQFVERTEASERLAHSISARQVVVADESETGRAELEKAEDAQRQELSQWLEVQTNRLLRQTRAVEIIESLMDHPVTLEHAKRLEDELEERIAREKIYRERRDGIAALTAPPPPEPEQQEQQQQPEETEESMSQSTAPDVTSGDEKRKKDKKEKKDKKRKSRAAPAGEGAEEESTEQPPAASPEAQ